MFLDGWWFLLQILWMSRPSKVATMDWIWSWTSLVSVWNTSLVSSKRWRNTLLIRAFQRMLQFGTLQVLSRHWLPVSRLPHLLAHPIKQMQPQLLPKLDHCRWRKNWKVSNQPQKLTRTSLVSFLQGKALTSPTISCLASRWRSSHALSSAWRERSAASCMWSVCELIWQHGRISVPRRLASIIKPKFMLTSRRRR